MRGRHGGEGMMEERDIGHDCLLIWFGNTYVCDVGRNGGRNKGKKLGVGWEREERGR